MGNVHTDHVEAVHEPRERETAPVERKRDYYFEIAGRLGSLDLPVIDPRGTRLEQLRDVYRFIIAEMLKPRLVADIGSYDLYEYQGRFYIKGHHIAFDRDHPIGDEFAGGSIRNGILYECGEPWAKEINIATFTVRDLYRCSPGWVYSTVGRRKILSTNHKPIPMGGDVEMQ